MSFTGLESFDVRCLGVLPTTLLLRSGVRANCQIISKMRQNHYHTFNNLYHKRTITVFDNGLENDLRRTALERTRRAAPRRGNRITLEPVIQIKCHNHTSGLAR